MGLLYWDFVCCTPPRCSLPTEGSGTAGRVQVNLTAVDVFITLYFHCNAPRSVVRAPGPPAAPPLNLQNARTASRETEIRVPSASRVSVSTHRVKYVACEYGLFNHQGAKGGTHAPCPSI